MILNLKKFSVNVENLHFKMETLKHALTLVSPNCFFCSLADLRDASYSVHMTEKSQNFLKFEWKGQLYKYTTFPNGLACCPRLFTKLLKPVMAQLHRLSSCSIGFLTKFIGQIVASFPSIKYSPLWYRCKYSPL